MTYDYVILAGDAKDTVNILNTTKHMNDGAPKIFEPLHTILKHMDGISNADPVKVATIWLSKPVNDTDHPVIVVSGYANVERITVLNHLSHQLNTNCSGHTSILPVVLRNCTDAACNRTAIWTTISAQIVAAIPQLSGAVLLEAEIHGRVGGVNLQLHQEKRRVRVDAIKQLGIPNLLLAGNWLETNDYPADGLERDLSLGREAANAVLLSDHVRQLPITVAHNKGDSVFRMFY